MRCHLQQADIYLSTSLRYDEDERSCQGSMTAQYLAQRWAAVWALSIPVSVSGAAVRQETCHVSSVAVLPGWSVVEISLFE